jgi:hypothetical protein
MQFQYWHEGLIFIGLFAFIIGFPCIMVAMLGTKLINYIGQYPSKCARRQMIACLQLFVIELISFAILALFYHIFSD